MVKVSLLFAFEARRGWMLDLNSWRWPLVLASRVPSGPVLRSPGRSHRKVLLQLKLAVDSFQQMTYGRCLALLLWIGEERYFSGWNDCAPGADSYWQNGRANSMSGFRGLAIQ